MSKLIQLFKKYHQKLYQGSSYFQRSIRNSLHQAEIYMKDQRDESDLDIKQLLEPFFISVQVDCKHFCSVFIEFLAEIYRLVSYQHSMELTFCVFKFFLDILKGNNNFTEEILFSLVKFYQNFLKQQRIFNLQPELQKIILKTLILLYDRIDNNDMQDMIQKIANEIIQTFFEEYNQHHYYLQFIQENESTKQLVDQLVHNSIQINSRFEEVIKGGYYKIHVEDICIFNLIYTITKYIEKNRVQTKTIKFITNLLTYSLKQNSDFYQTKIFNILLQNQIHISVISLCIDSRIQLVQCTANLIQTLWEEFSSIYVNGINELFVRGLFIALTSPDQETVIRSLNIFQRLSTKPQIFVDCFVNYDCDDTGHFSNVFQNIISNISKFQTRCKWYSTRTT